MERTPPPSTPPHIELGRRRRFVLSAPRLDDVEARRGFACDPAVADAFGWTVEYAAAATDAAYEREIADAIEAWEKHSRLGVTIRRAHTGEAVGTVELLPRASSELDVYVVVRRDLRRHGLATNAVGTFLSWLGMHGSFRAHAECAPANVAARRVAEKCGFVLAEERADVVHFVRDVGPPQAEWHPDAYTRYASYSIRREARRARERNQHPKVTLDSVAWAARFARPFGDPPWEDAPIWPLYRLFHGIVEHWAAAEASGTLTPELREELEDQLLDVAHALAPLDADGGARE